MKKLTFLLALFLFSSLPTVFAENCPAKTPCGGNDAGQTCIQLVGKDTCGKCCYKIPLRESIGETTVLSGSSGMDLVTQYIAMIYKYGASILGIICVLIIVISGIQISMGGAQSDLVASAKTRIFQALLSLAILFLSAVILKTINPGFFTLG